MELASSSVELVSSSVELASSTIKKIALCSQRKSEVMSFLPLGDLEGLLFLLLLLLGLF